MVQKVYFPHSEDDYLCPVACHYLLMTGLAY